MERNFTKGNITKSLVIFSIPMIIGNIFQQFYNVADTLIVGRTLGATALSAVGSSYAIMTLITSIILGFCMGGSVVFSQYYGANKYDLMKISITNAFSFILVISIIINIISFLLLDHMIIWLNIPTEAIQMTHDYLWIIFIGIFFIFIYNFFASVLRSIGNTVIPLVFLIVAAITNIVLDIVFITQFHMGVAGAAWATVIAQALSAVCIVIYYFYKAKHISPQRQHWKYNKEIIKSIINNSTLTAIQQSIMNLGILMVQGLVNSFGLAVSAAFAAVVKIDAFAYLPAQDFGNAFSIYVAQNYGALKANRIKKGLKKALTLSVVFCIISSLLVCFFAEHLMAIFISTSEHEVIQIGVNYLRIEGAFYIGIGILFIWYGYFRGLGKSDASIVLTIISLGIRVILAYILSAIPTIGLVGVWWSVPIGWAIADLVGLYLYKRVKLPSQSDPN